MAFLGPMADRPLLGHPTRNADIRVLAAKVWDRPLQPPTVAGAIARIDRFGHPRSCATAPGLLGQGAFRQLADVPETAATE